MRKKNHDIFGPLFFRTTEPSYQQKYVAFICGPNRELVIYDAITLEKIEFSTVTIFNELIEIME